MPAIVEQGIHSLSIADLAHLALLVRDLPVRGTFAPAFAFLVATNVSISCSFLDKDPLTVFFVVHPAALVSVAVRVRAGTLSMFLARRSGACQERTGIRVTGWGDVGPEAGVEAFE
jgi:hypothetical protein